MRRSTSGKSVCGALIAAAFGALFAVVAGPTLAADMAEGQKVFRKYCGVCHVAEKGSTKVILGPNLYGLVGRKAGSIEGFKYSEANRNSGIIWTRNVLAEYLENPKKVIPGTVMAFVGVKRSEEREDLIAFLESLQ
jgi:cytochrome c